MGRGATKAAGNPWYEARIRASKWNDKLLNREGAAEELNMSLSAVEEAETGRSKTMPVDKAVAMARKYCAPELLNYYCLNECPIGCKRAISADAVELERAVVKITQILRKEKVQWIKHGLQDIAMDGEVTEDELDDLDMIINSLRDVSKIISELEIIRDRVKSRKVFEKKEGMVHG